LISSLNESGESHVSQKALETYLAKNPSQLIEICNAGRAATVKQKKKKAG